jgi:hypothetical protein
MDDPSFAPLLAPNDLSEQTVSIRCQQSALAGKDSQFDLDVNTRVARVKEAIKKQDMFGEVSCWLLHASRSATSSTRRA